MPHQALAGDSRRQLGADPLEQFRDPLAPQRRDHQVARSRPEISFGPDPQVSRLPKTFLGRGRRRIAATQEQAHRRTTRPLLGPRNPDRLDLIHRLAQARGIKKHHRQPGEVIAQLENIARGSR